LRKKLFDGVCNGRPFEAFIESLDKLEVPAASYTYNITGMSAAHVIAILKSMVNNTKEDYMYKEDTVFTFNIENSPTISFSLEANPTPHQPGNGVIYRTGQRNDAYPYNDEFVRQLNKEYPSSTKEFAQHIKRVFKNNSELLKYENNKIIQDVYFLLLFEIGRRLVKDGQNSTSKKRDLDDLRISEAITIIVELFENKACSFKDVFLKKGKYHCFSGKQEVRRIAITRLLKQVKELKQEELELKDLEELFYLEESVLGIIGNLKELSFKESKKPSNKD